MSRFRRKAPALAALLSLALAAPFASTAGGRKAIDPAHMDTSVKPGDDFYQYANGAWLRNNPIPPDESRWGSFNELGDRNRRILNALMDEAAKTQAPKGSPTQMVGDFYASMMDSAAIEAQGAGPLEPEMKKIASIRTPADVQAAIARLQTQGVRVPFGLFAAQDAKQSTEVIVNIVQGGLGLPDRDYYTRSDDASKKLRDQYLAYSTRLFTLIGDNAEIAGRNAATVLAVETRLAGASRTRVQRRDPEANYNKMPLDSLAAITPGIDWPRLLDGMGIADRRPVNVGQPEFLKEVSAMMSTTPVEDWKTYLRWHVLKSAAPLLSAAFVEADFDFNGRALTGATQIQPRWKRAVQLVDGSIGDAVGQLYVARNFRPEAKARALAMVENLRAELRERIQNLEWMSPATKEQALRKLNAFGVKVGYPDVWRDYSTLAIRRGAPLDNVIASTRYEYRRNVAKLGKPVDRKEWGMTPPTVNAYYNSRLNEIVFPAGILQPPFFDAEADDAVNYGGIGAVIGHEMTHGFDDQGRKSDADGNLKDWWTAEDAEKYKARSAVIEKQYAAYVALDTLRINGKLTLGENTADIGGVSIAYGALQKALAGKQREKIDGFTPEQRFFLSYAQIWRNNIRPEALKLRLNTDTHSPGRFRTIGPLSNMAEFQQAFGLSDTDPMMRPPGERAKIW